MSRAAIEPVTAIEASNRRLDIRNAPGEADPPVTDSEGQDLPPNSCNEGDEACLLNATRWGHKYFLDLPKRAQSYVESLQGRPPCYPDLPNACARCGAERDIHKVVGLSLWDRHAWKPEAVRAARDHGVQCPFPMAVCWDCYHVALHGYQDRLARWRRQIRKLADTEGRACASLECRQPIPFEARRDVRYCSSACRQRAYRVRQKASARDANPEGAQ